MSDLNILEPAGEPLEQRGERCRSLRCKGMFLNGGLGVTEHESGDGNFWCNRTQRIFGPDDQLVSDDLCRHTGRSCYESVG
jgi:hypothetical protein